MSAPRRRIVRPAPTTSPAPGPQRQRQLQRLCARLERERAGQTRWLARLKRAFHAFEKSLARVAGLERKIARLQE
jgi:hypothetical protein